MRLKTDRRGQVRVIEAFFAATLLLSCLTIIPVQNNTRSISSSNDRLEYLAQNIFVSLNNGGYLAKLVDERDWQALRNCIEANLPLTLWFNLTIFDSNNQQLNSYPISNGGAISAKITSIELICASPKENFAIYIFQLQLALVD